MIRAKIKTAAPASRLATPTDLPPAEVRAVTGAVNPLIADALSLYLKSKNYHWHLSGPHFRDYHLLFDEQAEAILGSVDVLAERVRKIGGTTIRSISHVSELQTVADDNDDFVAADEMICRLLEDNLRMAETQRKAHKVCDEAGDAATAGLLEDLIDETERRIWFLYEISARDGGREPSSAQPASTDVSCKTPDRTAKSDWFLYTIAEGEDGTARGD